MYSIQHQSTEYLCPVKTRSNKLVSFQSLTVTQGYIMFWPTTLTVQWMVREKFIPDIQIYFHCSFPV